MESKASPGQHRAQDAAGSIGAGARQNAREAHAGRTSDDWLHEAPPPPARRPATAGKAPA